jgi:lambda family phage portal protein
VAAASPAVILGADGRPFRRAALPALRPRTAPVRARFDAADTTTENSRHWAAADSLSARAANSPEVRRVLRDRSRYESQNNSYARGIVRTIANDTVGTGPRLQLLTEDQEANRAIERAFAEWSTATGLALKLRTMCQARIVDGESFALLSTNPRLPTPVQLDLVLVEAEQVATPTIDVLAPDAVDGIEFDGFGNPIQYHLLRDHPGDLMSFGAAFGEFDRVPARFMLHWFRPDRAGQARAIPELTPALPLFAQLRRYTLAVIAAAETAADFAAVVHSAMAPDDGATDFEPFDEVEIVRRMMVTLPAGWQMSQFKAEQPATTYPDFKHEILEEIARCLGIPTNIARGNSSGYNYSSGRLDHQTYYKSIAVDQSDVARYLLDRILAAWMDEASLATRLLPAGPDRLGGWPHTWIWDGPEHVDPEKEANAQETRLRNGMTSFDEECYRQGVDPDVRAENIAKSIQRFKQNGIPTPATWGLAPPAPTPTLVPEPARPDDDDDEDTDDG